MKNILALSLLCISVSPVFAKRWHNIKNPQISSSTTLLAPGEPLIIKGSGFIKNYPEGHRIYLRNSRGDILKLEPDFANASELHAQTPVNLALGDYNIAIQLQTKWLRSGITSSSEKIKLRPKAPQINLNSKLVFQDLDELSNLDTKLIYQLLTPLQIGSNKLTAHYYQGQYLSMPSTEFEMMLIPENLVDSKLEVTSTQVQVRLKTNIIETELTLPINIYSKEEEFSPNRHTRSIKLSFNNGSSLINVSHYTQQYNGDFSRQIYLESPSNPRYLITKSYLSPIEIKQVHVKSPESVVLYNRSSNSIPLAGCSLSDNIMTRHTLELSSIATGDPFTYTGDLGLNDTGGDSLNLDCPCNHSIVTAINAAGLNEGFTAPLCTNSKVRLDSFTYTNLDANGYGI